MNDDIHYTPEQAPEEPPAHEIIARANDAFRQMPHPMMGEVIATRSVDALDEISKRQLFLLVQTFDQFNEDNDPHSEHDFGSIVFNGTQYFWQIDLFDRENRNYGSPDPTNPNRTWRVLTIMEPWER